MQTFLAFRSNQEKLGSSGGDSHFFFTTISQNLPKPFPHNKNLNISIITEKGVAVYLKKKAVELE